MHQKLIPLSVFHFRTDNVSLDAFMRQQEICLPCQYSLNNKKWTGTHQEHIVTSGGRDICLTPYFHRKKVNTGYFLNNFWYLTHFSSWTECQYLTEVAGKASFCFFVCTLQRINVEIYTTQRRHWRSIYSENWTVANVGKSISTELGWQIIEGIFIQCLHHH